LENTTFDGSKNPQSEKNLAQLLAEMITFDDAFKIVFWYHFNTSKKGAENQICRYNLYLRGTIGNMPLNKITKIVLEEVKIVLLRKNLKPQTIYHIFSLVSVVYNKILGWDSYFGYNPVKGMKLPKKDNRRTRFLEKEEAQALFIALDERSHETYLISLLSLCTGMRAGEIFSLTGDKVNLKTGFITIVDTKSEINRVAVIPNFLAKELGQISLKPGRLVFPKKDGGMRTEISNVFAKVVDKIGFNDGIDDARNKVVFHTLRHTYASLLGRNGQTILSVAELLGHKDLRMTKRYYHIGQQEKQAAADILDSFLS